MTYKHPLHGKFVQQGNGEPGMPAWEFVTPLDDDNAHEYAWRDYGVWSENFLGLHHWAPPEFPTMTAAQVQYWAMGFQNPMGPTRFHASPLIVPPNSGSTSFGKLTDDPLNSATDLQDIFVQDNTITPL